MQQATKPFSHKSTGQEWNSNATKKNYKVS